MANKSFLTQCPYCQKWENHDCSPTKELSGKVTKPFHPYSINDKIVNLSFHERQCKYCEKHFLTTEISYKYFWGLMNENKELKKENEMLKFQDRIKNQIHERDIKRLKDDKVRLKNELQEAKTELDKLYRTIEYMRSCLGMLT
ncbi:hypothetical protein Cri9333_1441 [Crinalium epipsammum PCC 9333]|uniref:Uncharacterized protein n=1 Tax=Crinalium epipsammum PCC 9333 TaxID=1173022 RepID=K9VYU5_9CYAN|nr:hypothetical protein [Crinalium epipsammum]AFZ12335.1 hypothetical protein Cri9333_1441 [Crinalium epipsammum PCC 9333]